MSVVTRSTKVPSDAERLDDWRARRDEQLLHDFWNLSYIAGGRNRYQKRHREPVANCPGPDQF